MDHPLQKQLIRIDVMWNTPPNCGNTLITHTRCPHVFANSFVTTQVVSEYFATAQINASSTHYRMTGNRRNADDAHGVHHHLFCSFFLATFDNGA